MGQQPAGIPPPPAGAPNITGQIKDALQIGTQQSNLPQTPQQHMIPNPPQSTTSSQASQWAAASSQWYPPDSSQRGVLQRGMSSASSVDTSVADTRMTRSWDVGTGTGVSMTHGYSSSAGFSRASTMRSDTSNLSNWNRSGSVLGENGSREAIPTISETSR